MSTIAFPSFWLFWILFDKLPKNTTIPAAFPEVLFCWMMLSLDDPTTIIPYPMSVPVITFCWMWFPPVPQDSYSVGSMKRKPTDTILMHVVVPAGGTIAHNDSVKADTGYNDLAAAPLLETPRRLQVSVRVTF
jgi:hypothetical protein